MLNSFALGFVAQTSLILCGAVVFWMTFRKGVIGLFGGLGAGLLLGAIAFDLVPSAEALSSVEISLWMIVGAGVFLVSDRIVEARFGDSGPGASLGIVIGSIIDGVPESLMFGIQIAAGVPVSAAFLVAVFVSNVPQALAPSADMAKSGWSMSRVVGLWALVALACGVAAALGWAGAEALSELNGSRAASFAMGGVLAMLADSLIPFSFEKAGPWAGAWTVLGFCIALAMG